nr:MAG TPA: hypothetical protein [Caudoviricetes sp.]DAH44774.1 MAG TPA: hypothetical protein [Caudoviricetes sp.]
MSAEAILAEFITSVCIIAFFPILFYLLLAFLAPNKLPIPPIMPPIIPPATVPKPGIIEPIAAPVVAPVAVLDTVLFKPVLDTSL